MQHQSHTDEALDSFFENRSLMGTASINKAIDLKDGRSIEAALGEPDAVINKRKLWFAWRIRKYIDDAVAKTKTPEYQAKLAKDRERLAKVGRASSAKANAAKRAKRANADAEG